VTIVNFFIFADENMVALVYILGRKCAWIMLFTDSESTTCWWKKLWLPSNHL